MARRGSNSPFHSALRDGNLSDWSWSILFQSENDVEASEMEKEEISRTPLGSSLNIRLGGHFGGLYPDLPKNHPLKVYMRNRLGKPITEKIRLKFSAQSKISKKFRKLTDDDIQYIISNPDGLSKSAIARKLGVDPSYVSRTSRGVKAKRHVSEETWANLDYEFIMRNKGIITGADLAKKFNTTVTVISWILNGHVKPQSQLTI